VVIGLVLGWLRWRSGSTLLTILCHSLINLGATIETVIASDWLS
jgi:membrane protease YdiL (CAAX protease family)